MRWIAVLAWMCSGCFSKPDQRLVPADGDGGSDGRIVDAPADGSIMPGQCAMWGPWSAPSMYEGIDSSSLDLAPWLSPDKRDLYFYSDRMPEGLFHAKRTSSDNSAAFDAPTPLVLTVAHQAQVAASADGLTLWFTAPAMQEDIVRATRMDTTGAFGNGTPESNLNTMEREGDAEVSFDGLTMVYAAGAAGNDSNIFVAKRNSTSDLFSAGVRIGGVTGQYDCCPSLSADGATVYWEQQVDATSQYFIVKSSRSGNNWSAPTRIPELPTTPINLNFAAPHISVDGRTLSFTSGLSLDYALGYIERECLDP